MRAYTRCKNWDRAASTTNCNFSAFPIPMKILDACAHVSEHPLEVHTKDSWKFCSKLWLLFTPTDREIRMNVEERFYYKEIWHSQEITYYQKFRTVGSPVMKYVMDRDRETFRGKFKFITRSRIIRECIFSYSVLNDKFNATKTHKLHAGDDEIFVKIYFTQIFQEKIKFVTRSQSIE
jgi:hypothetical protein